MSNHHIIPRVDWQKHLANAVWNADDGDTIIVDSEAKMELGKAAIARMCPDKEITIKVNNPQKESEDIYADEDLE